MTTTILTLPGADGTGGVPEGYSVGTIAQGINNLGEVAGFAQLLSSSPAALIDLGFVYSDETYKEPPVTSPDSTPDSILYGLNDEGMAVGVDFSTRSGLLYDFKSGSTSAIAPPTESPSSIPIPYSISDTGEIVGSLLQLNSTSSLGTVTTGAFILRGGVYSILPALNGSLVVPRAVNNSGAIAGYYDNSDNSSSGFIYSDSKYTILDFPGATATLVAGLDNKGDAVGQYFDGTTSHAFYFDGQNFYNIDALLSSSLPHDTNFVEPNGYVANGINDSGQIVGNVSFQGATDGGIDHLIAVDTTFDTSEATIACFCMGTKIRTPNGDLPVEGLRINDQVISLSGASRAIKWIGTRSYNIGQFRDNHLTAPILIARDAIDRDIPSRDLLVSPGHGIYIEGTLIPAWRLLNGLTITQLNEVQEVHYFHLELEAHEVIFAEGCPTESFVDDDCRNQFDNAAEYYMNHWDDAPGYSFRLPRTEEGFHLEAIRLRLAIRAGKSAEDTLPGELRGFIDSIGPVLLEGWALDVACPERPVALEVLAAGRLVASIVANKYREDLRREQIGSGCHAFSFQLPGGLEDETILVRRISDGAMLPCTAVALSSQSMAA